MSHLLRRLRILTGVVSGDPDARLRFSNVFGRAQAKLYRRYFYFVGRVANTLGNTRARAHSKRILRMASMTGEDNSRVSQWREFAAQYFHASAANCHRRVFLDEIQNQALMASISDDFEAAVFNYRVAIELSGSPADSHYGLGRMLLSQNKAAEAYFHFESAISALEPNREKDDRHLKANAYWSQAEVFIGRDMCIAAIERFQNATVFLDRFGAGQRLCADQLRRSGNLQEAASCFDFITTYAHRPMAEFIPDSAQVAWLDFIDQHGISALDVGIVESTRSEAVFHSGLIMEYVDARAASLASNDLIRAYFDSPKAWKVSLPQDIAEISVVRKTVTSIKK